MGCLAAGCEPPIGSTEPRDGRLRVPWQAERAYVVEQRPLLGGWMELVLQAPYIATRARPGHFIQVDVRAGRLAWDPFLRRPFSLYRIEPQEGRVSVVYRPSGRGTGALAAVAAGEPVEVLGPLGRSFPEPLRPGIVPQSPLLLVGEGHGVLVLACAARWAASAGRAVHLVAGARTADGLAAREQLASLGVPVHLMTEDQSLGEPGSLVEAVPGWLARVQAAEVWASGSVALLAAVQRLCRQAGIAAYLNVERPMACGFGVCMGCSVPRAGPFGRGYWHACVDGPIFHAEEVVLDGGFEPPARAQGGGAGAA